MITAHPAQAPKCARLRPTQLGFTLIEVAIVLGVVAALAAVAVPQLRPLSKQHQLRETAEEVAGFLDRARRHAYNQGRCMRISLSSGALVLERRTHADCTTAGRIDNGDWQVIEGMRPQYSHISLAINTTGGGPANKLIFRPQGWLRGGGGVQVNNDSGRVQVTSSLYPNNKYAVNVTVMSRVCVRHIGATMPGLSSSSAALCP